MSPSVPYRPDETQFGPSPITDSLNVVSRKMGMSEAAGLGRLFTHWSEIVGEGMASHVQPVRLDADALVVRVDHPAWATQVRSMAEELLDRVTQHVGGVRPGRIDVRIQRE